MRERSGALRLAPVAVNLCACLAIVFMLATAPARAGARGEAPDIGGILEECRLFAEAMSRSSGSFSVAVEDDRRGGDFTPWVAREGRWILSDGRFREESVTTFRRGTVADSGRQPPAPEPRPPGPRQEPQRVRLQGDWRRVVVFDGKQGTADTYNDSGTHVSRDRFNGPDAGAEAMRACYIAEWLGLIEGASTTGVRARIPGAKDKPVVLSREVVSGIECVKIASTVPEHGWWHVWWVAPDYDYLVMRVDSIRRGPREGILLEGESIIRRRRVTEVTHLDEGVHLPLAAENVAAKVGRDGKVLRVYRRERFAASNVRTNLRASDDEFQIPRIPGVSPSLSEPEVDDEVGGCAYDATLAFSAVMGVELEAADAQGLLSIYENQDQASFADIASDLESILGAPVAGYAGTLADVACLDEPVIAQLRQTDGRGHFVVIESLTGENARIFDNQIMRMVSTDELSRYCTGKFLVVDRDRSGSRAREGPRLVCDLSILPSRPAHKGSDDSRWVFRLTNVGTAAAEIHSHRLHPPDAPLDVGTPTVVPPGGVGEVVVEAKRRSIPQPWAVCLSTNDPCRPTLWVGSGEASGRGEDPPDNHEGAM